MSSGLVMTMGVDLAPRVRPQKFLGVWAFVQRSGAAIGQVVVGLVSKACGGIAAGSLASAGVAVVGGAYLVAVVRETRPESDSV